MPKDKAQDRRRLARQLAELQAVVITPLAAECAAVAGAVPCVSTWHRCCCSTSCGCSGGSGGGGGDDAAGSSGPGGWQLDWSAIPASCDPGSAIAAGSDAAAASSSGAAASSSGASRGTAGGARQAARARRKRLQVESFALVLRTLLGPPDWGAGGCGSRQHAAEAVQQPAAAPQQQQHSGAQQGGQQRRLRVVDFGSGTGNLLLPLAAAWRRHEWVAVEMKPAPLQLLRARAGAAGLSNVTTFQGMIEDWRGPFDVALALHACGNATDRVLQMAAARGAAYVCSPCCVGKLKFSMAGGTSFSAVLRSYTPQQAGARPQDRLPVAAALAAQAAAATAAAPLSAGDAASAAAGAAGGEGGGGGGGVDGGQLPPLAHPRSAWLRSRLPDPERHFRILARVADATHSQGDPEPPSSGTPPAAAAGGGNKPPKEGLASGGAAGAAAAAAGQPADEGERPATAPPLGLAAAAKVVVELDRNAAAAEEAGYAVGIFKVLGAMEMSKTDLIVGLPPGGGCLAGAGVAGGSGEGYGDAGGGELLAVWLQAYDGLRAHGVGAAV